MTGLGERGRYLYTLNGAPVVAQRQGGEWVAFFEWWPEIRSSAPQRARAVDRLYLLVEDEFDAEVHD